MASKTLTLNKLVSSDFSEGSSWVLNKGGGGDTDVGYFVFNSLGTSYPKVSSVSFKINAIETGGNNLFGENINLNFEFGKYSGSTFTKASSFSFSQQGVKESQNQVSITATSSSSKGSEEITGGNLCVKLTITPQSNSIGSKIVMSGFSLSVTYEVATCTAIFNNYDGTELQRVSVTKGSTPSYTGATPTKEPTTQCVYTFSGWSPAIGAITSNTTYTAQFVESPRPYWVTATSRSKDCEIRGSQYYNYGDIITLEAYNFAEHKEFHYWRNHLGDVTFESYSNPLVVTLNEELLARCPPSSSDNVYFECCTRGKIYTLKAEVLPDSAMGSVYFSTILTIEGENWWGDKVEVIVPNEGVTYRYGETEYSLGFKAVPNKGYRFVKWSDGVTDNPRIIAGGDYSYTAIFEEDTYTVKVSAIPPEGGTITGGGVYPSGEPVDIDIDPNKGYKLIGYYENSVWTDCSPNLAGIFFYAKEDTEIVVHFEKLPPPKFTSAEMKYLDKQISSSNKVICNEGFILSVAVT